MKLYAILLALILFSFFSNDFGLVDIQKTAIILAAGVDRTEEGFALTAQIAVPKGSDRTTGGTSTVEIGTTGKTVSDCISNIFSETGWVPKLVFCNLILLGENAVHEDVIAHLNYFLRNDYMPDSCMVATCAGSAKELLSSHSAIDDSSSFAIAKLFSDAALKSGKVLPKSLREFAIDYYGVSESSYMPYLRMKTQAGDSTDSGEGSSPSEGSGGGEKPQQVYIAEETAIFSAGKMVGILPAEQTIVFSLLQGNVFSGTINAMDEGVPVTLTVVKNDGGISLSTKGAPTAKLDLAITVRLCCRGVTAVIEDVSSDSVTPEIRESAKEILNSDMQKLWDIGKESGCDLFNLKGSLYRSSLKKYAEWKESLLDVVQPQISTKVDSIK